MVYNVKEVWPTLKRVSAATPIPAGILNIVILMT